MKVIVLGCEGLLKNCSCPEKHRLYKAMGLPCPCVDLVVLVPSGLYQSLSQQLPKLKIERCVYLPPDEVVVLDKNQIRKLEDRDITFRGE